MKWPISLFSFCCILLLGLGCKGSKKAVGTSLKAKPARYVMKRLAQNEVDLEWFSGKGSISYRDEEQSVKGRFNLRLRKDSVIWMNVKKFSLEGARILVTRDSVFAIDRIGKFYIAKDFNFITQRYNLPASFAALQDLILGNPVLLTETRYESSVDKNDYRLTASVRDMDRSYWVDGLFFQLRKMAFAEPAFARNVVVEQKDFQPVGGERNFSYLRKLNLKSPDTGELSIEIDFSKVEINTPKSIRFEIPSSYTRLD
ncbi:MAG: DUF4292 domain-containing protein [Bacteroidota bacterium]